MDKYTFYLEQYRLLREEIIFTLGQLYNTEMYAAIAASAIYLWLSIYDGRLSVRAVWLIPPVLIFASAIHCLLLVLRVSMIGEYLKDIENVFVGNGDIHGWEHFKVSHPSVDTADFVLASCAWLSVFVASVAISWSRAKKRQYKVAPDTSSTV
jgi:hypothetical protein